MSWRKEITDPVSPIVAEQTIGISEAFNIRIDDVWLGLWGIIRAYGRRVNKA